jgi:hypothetical protein
MLATDSTTLLIIAAALLAAVAVLLWWVFLRPVVRHTALGVITAKTFRPDGTHWQYHPGSDRGFRTPTRIPIAAAYVFRIHVEGLPADVRYALNTVAAERYDVGQQVAIEYEERGLAGLWRRVSVTDMKPAPSTAPAPRFP